MKKCLFLLVMLFSLTVQANWSTPYYMDHERFVHLSPSEQEEVIIRTMEMMVELEAKYQREVMTSGFSQERYQKYVQVLKKIQSFLLSEAVAQTEGDHKKITNLALDFGQLLGKLGSKGCIYGGYVSKIVTVNGKKFCRHPSLIDAKDKDAALIKKAYLAVATKDGKKCAAPAEITCNPVVFGYAKAEEPFCVKTGAATPAKAHNVSYECMKKSLGEGRDERLKDITEAMKGNKKAFDDVHNFIFRTCACGDTKLDADYLTYMRPHRTCFGMLNSMRDMGNEKCNVLFADENKTEFANEWSKYFGKTSGFDDLTPAKTAPWDKAYGELIQQMDKSHNLCHPPKEPKETEESSVVCTAECKAEKDTAGKEKIFCTITDATVTVKKLLDGKEISSTPTKYEASKFKEVKVELTDAAAKELTFTLKEGEKQSIKCPVQAPQKDACTIAITEDEKNITAKVTINGAKIETVNGNWKPDGAVKDPKVLDVVRISNSTAAETFTFTGKMNNKDFSCTATRPAKAPLDDKKYTIVAKTAEVKDEDLKATVNATVKKGDEDITSKLGDLKIIWSRSAATDRKVAGTDAAAEGGEAIKTDTTDASGEKDEIGNDKSITLDRLMNKDFNACARLVDAKGTVVAEKSCDKVPGREEKKEPATTPTTTPTTQPQNYQPAGNQPPPPVFLTPTINSRTWGID